MKRLLINSLLTLAMILLAPNAMAISIGFSSLTNLNPFAVSNGDSVAVDVVITDRGSDIVTAYDIDIAYDSNILTATDVNFGGLLGTPPSTSQQSFDLTNPGIVDITEQSLLDEALLEIMQPDDFTLATVTFNAIADGVSDLDLIWTTGNSVSGANNQVIIDTNVSVSGNQLIIANVPEPTSIALLSMGAIVAFGLKKRKEQINI